MIKLEYFPEKRGKTHDFVIFSFPAYRIKLLRGLTEVTDVQLGDLENVPYFQQFVEQGAIVVHEEKPKTARKSSTAKTTEKQTELKDVKE